jgi:hypothetical protein
MACRFGRVLVTPAQPGLALFVSAPAISGSLALSVSAAAAAAGETSMRRPDLLPDCGRCAAICCVATTFDASEDFALDKPAGVACENLTGCRCAIHDELVGRGFRGCAAYDCYGAGPRITRAFADAPGTARRRDAAFLVLRSLHELLWLLTEAAKLCPPSHGELGAELVAQIDAIDAIASGPMQSLPAADLPRHDRASRALLRRVGTALGGRRRATRSLGVVRSG